MKRGIVIGKFMPVHRGHLALIEFAASRCDELVVAVDKADGTIPLGLRLGWMRGIFQGRKNILIRGVRRALPQDEEPSRRASRAWARYLEKRFGRFDLVFSSEGYGELVAEYLRAENRLFDPERKQVPVSATMIREHPFAHWEFIPEAVRPYFVKRVCVYGPESCGKTTMAAALARHYRTAWVPEYARVYSEKRDHKFDYADMDRFARMQTRQVAQAARQADKLLFSDTDALTTEIYSRHYFGRVSSVVAKFAAEERYDFYLFLDTDLPWKKDPLRDAGHLRAEHRRMFLAALERHNLPYVIIRGKGEERVRNAVRAVDAFAAQFY